MISINLVMQMVVPTGSRSGIHYTHIEGNLPLTGHVYASRKDFFQGSDCLSTQWNIIMCCKWERVCCNGEYCSTLMTLLNCKLGCIRFGFLLLVLVVFASHNSCTSNKLKCRELYASVCKCLCCEPWNEQLMVKPRWSSGVLSHKGGASCFKSHLLPATPPPPKKKNRLNMVGDSVGSWSQRI